MRNTIFQQREETDTVRSGVPSANSRLIGQFPLRERTRHAGKDYLSSGDQIAGRSELAASITDGSEYDFLPNIRERERRAVFLVNRAACATVYVHREATCALILGIKNGVENEILVTSRDSINLAKIAID